MKMKMTTYTRILASSLVIVLSSLAPAGAAFEVALGDDLDAVTAALGEPQGYMLTGTRAVLTYERGKVELRDDKVVSVDLVSPDVAAARKTEAEAARRQREAQQAARGTRLRDAKLDDPEFLFLPPTQQFAFWRSFRQQYPAIDLAPVGLSELAARASAEEQAFKAQAETRAETLKDADLMALEWRVQEAEARAEEAALAARRAETRSRSSGFYGGWTSTRWPTTVVIGGGPTLCSPPVAVPYRAPCGIRAPTVQPHGRAVFGGFSRGATFHQSSSGASFFPTQKQ